MTLKFVIIFTFIAAANAGSNHVPQNDYLGHQQTAPHHNVVLQKTQEEYPNESHPAYNFEYKVHDSISGDSKSQTETRKGNVVQGEYSLIDADGFLRTVKYTADDATGFNAVVHREPIRGHKDLTTNHASSVHVTPLETTQYHNAPTAYVPPKSIVQAPVRYATPSYGVSTAYFAPKTIVQAPFRYATPSYGAPFNHHAHPKQYVLAQTYTTYESPEQASHKSHYHQ